MMLRLQTILILYGFIQIKTGQSNQIDTKQHLVRPKEEIKPIQIEPVVQNVLTSATNTIIPDTGDTILSIQRIPRKRIGNRQVSRRGRNDGDSEAVRQRLDSIILMVSRIGDRLVSMETVQSQWKERIDNIQYRLTKMEVMNAERKGQLTDVSNTLRHRLESTDRELEILQTLIEGIKTKINGIDEKNTLIKRSVDTIALPDGNKSKMQAVMAAVFGVKNDVQKLSTAVKKSNVAVNSIENSTRLFSGMSESLVTKSYLRNTVMDNRMSGTAGTMYPMTQHYTIPRKNDQAKKKADPQDCWEIKKKLGKKTSGVYRIQPLNAPLPFFVYCDMETAGGGWTVIQRRHDGTVNFRREWIDYKHGFGNLAGEFWLGNEKIYQLTNYHVSELEIQLADFDQQTSRAHYSAFSTGNEAEGYALKLLGHYEGDAGDSLLYHVGQRWSTIDSDSDSYPERNCARDHMGAWWYKACDTSNLNGNYLHGPVPIDHEYKGLYWYDFRGPSYSLWKSIMMVRRGGSVKGVVFDPKSAVIPTLNSRNLINTTTIRPKDFNPDYDPYVTFDYGYDHMG